MKKISIVTLISISVHFVVSLNRFELDTSWPHESVSSLAYYGSGIILDAENNLIVLHRSDAMDGPRNETIKEDVVMVIDRSSGKVLRQWGRDKFYHPHGIEVTTSGDIFITDSRLHQVFKFEFIPETKLWNEEPVISLGEPFVIGNDSSHFGTPAAVAVEHETENFYVADGYINTRVVLFDKYGNYLLEFQAGTSTPFNIVHFLTIAVRHSTSTHRAVRQNTNPEDVLIFVADRNNCRIQAFNSTGSFLYELTCENLGLPNAWMFSVAHVNVNPRNPPYNADFSADYGIVYGVNGFLPDRSPQVLEIGVGGSNATVLSSFDTSPGDLFTPLELPHDLAISRDGSEVYVVIADSKLVLRRFRMIMESGVSRNLCRNEIFFVMLASLTTASLLLY